MVTNFSERCSSSSSSLEVKPEAAGSFETLWSHLGDYWHMSSRLSHKYYYTQLEKSTDRSPLTEGLHSCSCISGVIKLQIKCRKKQQILATEILCVCREGQKIFVTTDGQFVLLFFWGWGGWGLVP